MIWQVSNRADPSGNRMAKHHYTCQSPDSDQFVPPGRCVVLVVPAAAVWVTSWPFPEYVKHAWPGAWVNSIFRNERRDLYLSSEVIRQAIAATRWFWEPPSLGMISFVDATKVKHKRDPGRCFIKAGFHLVRNSHGEPVTTKDGKLTFQIMPDEMPPAEMPLGAQGRLIA